MWFTIVVIHNGTPKRESRPSQDTYATFPAVISIIRIAPISLSQQSPHEHDEIGSNGKNNPVSVFICHVILFF